MSRDLGDHRVAIKAEEGHGGRQHAGPLILALVEQLLRRRGDDRVDAISQMAGGLHPVERRLDLALGVRQKRRDTGEALFLLGVENMEDRADEQGVAGLLPVVSTLEASFGIDQHVGDILHVAHFPRAAPDFEERIIGRRCGVRRIEEQHPAMLCAKARGELPVLTLDVMNDAAPRPGQQGRHHEADALPGSGRREAEDMLGAIVAQIGSGHAPENDAIGAQHVGSPYLAVLRPACRSIGLGPPALARTPHRHADRDDNRQQPARRGDRGAAVEDRRRIGVERKPPPEEGWRRIDGIVTDAEPGSAERRLKSERFRRRLGRGPDRREDDQQHREDLAP